ncbi:uncharacterized protein ACN427_013179 [Glossina fuscipes fuscipes]
MMVNLGDVLITELGRFRHFCQYSLSHHNIASKIFFCDIIDDESGSNNIEEEINQIIENINNTKTYCRVIDLLVPKGAEHHGLVYQASDRARLTITTQDFFRCAENPLFY